MPRVIIVQVIYNSKKWIRPVFESVFNQTFKDFKFVAVMAGNDDGSKELIASEFPEVEIIDPGFNIGFAKGHNLVFEQYQTLTRPSDGHPLPEGEGNRESLPEFFQLVNPDLILEPNYIEQMLKAFDDEKVGAATGKLYKIYDLGFKIEDLKISKIIDSTGVVISKSGRARDRGQHEVDKGQYDKLVDVQAVSGAGAMYRRTALESIKLSKSNNLSAPPKAEYLPKLGEKNNESSFEYFDEDFHSYWEDVDLAWRMTNAGYKCVFAPTAIGYHGRTAGSSRGGYVHMIDFIKHHQNLPEKIRQLNYKNHIFMYIKNSRWFYPQFFIREFFMLIYVILFEISTLKVLPEMLKTFPKIWKKRKLISQ